MPRILRRLSVVAVLVGAWALVGSDRAPVPLTMSEAVAGPGSWRGGAEGGGEQPPHDLSSLRVLTKVILYVKDNYVDPKRVRPKEMMVSALEYVEKSAPEVLVEGGADSGKLKVNVNGKVRDFDISHVDSLWKMSFMLKDVFDHVGKNLRQSEDTRDIEYAAINGMLSTLDPHSVLLRPELYREMKLSTKGEFGGLGFVIQMKEGNLTVNRVLPKTPASRAGIKKDDQITRIGEESTVNMDLNEAVSKLRGPVDSKVAITVLRPGGEPRTLSLGRAMISIESVQHKLLAQNVGYVRLKNFQGNTTRDLQAALREMRQQAAGNGGLKGLVLDMRGNPGGLLDQAIQVSDLFLDEGTIVSTVGFSNTMREEKPARKDPSDKELPVAVLVNAGSASASEIVAGALKNLDRAVIIGRQTFGKGSVQVLYDFPDDSALKLTIAKYLTPGDKSIQEIGIVPDVELTPTRVTKDRVNVYAPRKSLGEADLDQHFGNPESDKAATKRAEVVGREKPLVELRYLKEDEKTKDVVAQAPEDKKPAEKPAKTAAAPSPLLDVDTAATSEELDDQLDAESQDEVKEDFDILFARDYVLKAPFTSRKKMLEGGRDFVEQQRREQTERINGAIAALGLDWSAGPTPAQPQVEATLSPGPAQKLAAGEQLELKVTVANRGGEPLKRVRGWTESENPFLDRREFVFGALKPGEQKTWTVPVRLPKDLPSRRDDLTLKLFDDKGELPGAVVSEIAFVELPRPAFAYTAQVVDRCPACNGDGVTQRGEEVEVVLDVTNTGTGKALDTFAQIKNAGDPAIFIQKGRFKLGELAPGETKTARFTLEVKKAYQGETYPLKLAIIDEPLEEFLSTKMELPVNDAPLQAAERKGLVKVAEQAALLSSPTPKGAPLAKLPKGAVLEQQAAVGEFVRVGMGEDRFAFVRKQDVQEVKKGKAALPKDVQFVAQNAPPRIALEGLPQDGVVVAEGDRFSLTGTVADPAGLLDMYVLVNDQKVFFRTVDPKSGDAKSLRFTTDFPLKEGNNNVLVVARETPDFSNRRTLIIRRRPAALAQKLGALQPPVAPQQGAAPQK
jgi:carboxyl-terminal processing protease